MTATLVTPEPVLWTPQHPNQCCCGYVTQRRGRLIIREPALAWSMNEEKNRDYGSLQERMRTVCRVDYQLGYQHYDDSRKSYPGFPDCHLWPLVPEEQGTEHVFIELKRMWANTGQEVSAAQIDVMGQLLKLSPVYLVRPCCLLCGAVDLLLCRHFGGEPRSSYAGGDPGAVFLSQLARDEARAKVARADVLAPSTRPAPVQEGPPGEPGLPDHVIGPATAVVVPPPGGNDAIREVEAWMRVAGFPPASTRYPLRFVIAVGVAVVEVSTGLAVAGQPAPREWRWTLSRFHFPFRLAETLNMVISDHPSIRSAAAAAERVKP